MLPHKELQQKIIDTLDYYAKDTRKTRSKRVMGVMLEYMRKLNWEAYVYGKTASNGKTFLDFEKQMEDEGYLPKTGNRFMPIEHYLKKVDFDIPVMTIDSSQLIQTLPTRNGEIKQITNWFNCSIARYHGKIYFAYRMDFAPFAKEMKIGLCMLNEDFTVIPETNTIATLHSNYDGWHVEDPRLFIHNDVLHLSYTDGYQMGQAIIDQHTLRVRESYYLKKRLNMLTEKNWVFFSEPQTGKLYSIYNTSPYTIFEMDDVRHKVHLGKSPSGWQYGKISGGASPILHGDYFYHFFHSSVNGTSETTPVRRQYFCGCYVMENKFPFKIVAITKEPLLAGQYIKPSIPRLSKDIYVVFPGGAMRSENGWWLSYGWNDYECRVAMISDEILNNNLQWFDK